MLRSSFMFLWFTTTTCLGQSKIDSLTQALATTPSSAQFEILQALHDQYKLSDYAKALEYAKLALKHAKLLGDSVKIIDGGRMVAFSLLDLAKNQEALSILDSCLQIARRNEKRLPQIQPKLKSILNNMGLAAMFLAQHDKALSYHFQSLILREEEGNQKSITTALNNIALTYYSLGDYENALKYYQQALAIKRENKDSSDLENLLINIGLCLSGLNQYPEALKSVNEALNLCGDRCNKVVLMYANYCIAQIYYLQNDIPKAEALYLQALKLSEDQNDIRYSMITLVELGKIEFNRKNYNQSLQYFLKAKKRSNPSDYPMIETGIYEYLTKIYQQKSDLRSAFFNQSIQLHIIDSMRNSKFANRLSSVQIEHNEREYRKALANKDKLVTLQAEAIQTQQKISLFIGLIALLSIVVIGTIYRNYRMRLRINKVLEEKVKARTRELEESRDQALRTTYERDHRLTRLTAEVQSMLATIHGLCEATRMDDENKKIYLEKLTNYTATLKAMLSVVN